MATKDQIQEIKARADIVSIISRYVTLKKVGKNYVGLCPFHNEKTPSFTVNPQLGIFKCFGCGKAGDIFTFLQEIERIDFSEALEQLAKETGVNITQNFDNTQLKRIKVGKKLLQKATEFYHYLLTKHKIGAKALEYLTDVRKLTKKEIESFKLGFAPPGRDTFKRFAQKLGFTNDDLQTFGMLNMHGNDKFFNRIMFPIFDKKGDVIGFSGRVFLPNDNRPKYLNSPETLLFKKRFNLFGLYQAKQAILQNDFVILVEGQMDVISAHKIGIKNIVAPLGTGLTETQLMMLGKYTKNIVFAFDIDLAGQKSIQRGVIMALSQDLEPFVVDLQDFQDIDEAIRQDPEKLKALIAKRQPFFDRAFSKLQSKLGDYKQLEIEVKNLLNVISHASALKQEVLIKELSQISGIDKEVLSAMLKSDIRMQITPKVDRSNLEDYVISLLLQFPVLGLLTRKDPNFAVVFKDKAHVNIYSKIDEFITKYFKDISKNQNEMNTIQNLRNKNEKNDNDATPDKSNLYTLLLDAYAQFQKNFTDKYKIECIEPLKDDPENANAIFKLGINTLTNTNEFGTDLIDDFLDSVKRLKRQFLNSQIALLQQDLTDAELAGDADAIKDLERQLQTYLDEIRSLR